jgi:hypothetical protein
MKRPARRSILRMIALLLSWLIAGAALNVAVAWGCALKYFSIGGSVQYQTPGTWPREVPPEWPPPSTLISDGKWGYRQIVVQVDRPALRLEGDWPGTRVGQFWMQGIQQCGLPMLSMEWVSSFSSDWEEWRIDGLKVPSYFDDGNYHRRIPTTILWPGFAVNTLFYAGVLWMLFCAPFALQRMIRRRRGRCAHCNYPIGQSLVCTECGAAVPPRPGGAQACSHG